MFCIECHLCMCVIISGILCIGSSWPHADALQDAFLQHQVIAVFLPDQLFILLQGFCRLVRLLGTNQRRISHKQYVANDMAL